MNGKEQRVGAAVLAGILMFGGVGGKNQARAEGVTPKKTIETNGVMPSQEAERTSREVIIENMVNFLNSVPGYTDEEIKDGLIRYISEEERLKRLEKNIIEDNIRDIGRIDNKDIEGNFLGYLKTSNEENLLLFFGTKDINLERVVTAVRVPLYIMTDKSVSFGFSLDPVKNHLILGSNTPLKYIREEAPLLEVLSSVLNKNVVFHVYTEEISDNELKKYSKMGGNLSKYVNEMKDNIYFARSLDAIVYSNGIKLEYSDPERSLWSIDDSLLVNGDVFRDLVEGDVDQVPIIIGIGYPLVD